MQRPPEERPVAKTTGGSQEQSVHQEPEPSPAPTLQAEQSRQEHQSPTPFEFRAAWVTRWDWQDAEDIEQIIADLATSGFNAVYFQVRGAADAYYRSKIVPWASRLAGKLGADPEWDPLQVAIDSARRHGIELHAWFNACTAWKGEKRPGPSTPPHMAREHPEWLVRGRDGKPLRGAGGYLFFNPAIPAFRKHILSVVAELVSFYHLDGLHLDYIRYPAAESSYDRIGLRSWKLARRNTPGLDLATFERRRLTELVKEIKTTVHEIRPGCEVSAAVFGIWKNRWGWENVIQGYVDFHQDSHGWAKARALDTLVPMLYWPPAKKRGARTDFNFLAEDFLSLAGKVRLVAGIRADKVSFAQFERQLRTLRQSGWAGVALFSYRLLVRQGWLEKLRSGPFSAPALTRPPEPQAAQTTARPSASQKAQSKLSAGSTTAMRAR